MSAVLKRMTADEFLVWCLDQEGKWELVNGEPVLMMAGATQAHDQVVVNLLVALRTKLRSGPCRPTTDDVAARMTQGNIRRPDVTVDCGPPNPQSLSSSAPTVFFEVLSPSTRAFDFWKKPEEYKRVPSVRHIVLIDPDEFRIWLWSRASEDAAWSDQDVVGPDAVVELSAIGVSLPIAEIYEDVFPPAA